MKFACQITKYRSFDKCYIFVVLLAIVLAQKSYLCQFKLVQSSNFFHYLYKYPNSLSYEKNKR